VIWNNIRLRSFDQQFFTGNQEKKPFLGKLSQKKFKLAAFFMLFAN
jgi:hypothetical protein